MRKRLCCVFFIIFCTTSIFAQKIIVAEQGSFYGLDAHSGFCSYNPLPLPTCFLMPNDFPFSMAMFKDTLYYTDQNGDLYRSVLNTTSCNLLDTGIYSSVLGADKNGFLYWIDEMNNLIHYDPHIKKQYNLGELNFSPSGDLVFWGDNLVMASYEGLVIVNTNKPSASTLCMTDNAAGFWGLANISNTCDTSHIIGFLGTSAPDVFEIDMVRKTSNRICSTPDFVFDAASVQETGGVGSSNGDTSFSVIDTSCCAGSPALLHADYIAGANYVWDDNSTQQSRTVTAAGTYWVTIQNSDCIYSDTINCNFINGPQIYLPKDTLVCKPGPIILQPTSTLPGAPANTYEWQDGSMADNYKVTKAGIYILTTTNVCGNVIDSSVVNFQDCTCTFYVANAFTPNNDGLNDVFFPQLKCTISPFVQNYRFTIFNRWGELLFSSSTIGEGWNGRFKNTLQSIGTYVWQLQYYDGYSQKLINKSGTVLLIR